MVETERCNSPLKGDHLAVRAALKCGRDSAPPPPGIFSHQPLHFKSVAAVREYGDRRRVELAPSLPTPTRASLPRT